MCCTCASPRFIVAAVVCPALFSAPSHKTPHTRCSYHPCPRLPVATTCSASSARACRPTVAMGVGVSIPVVRVNTPGVRLQLLPDQTAYCRLQLNAADSARLRDAEQKSRVCVDIHCRVIEGGISGAYMAVKTVNRNDAAIAPYAPPPQHINTRTATAGPTRLQPLATPPILASQLDSSAPQQRYLTDHSNRPQPNGDVHLRLLPRHTDNFAPASYFLSIVGGPTHGVLDVVATIQTLPHTQSDRQPATVYMNHVAYINRPHLIGDRQRILSDDAYIEQLQWRIVDLERELGQSNCSVLDSAHSLRLQKQNASLLIELDDVKRELDDRKRAESEDGELRGGSAYEERAVILQLEAQAEQYRSNAKQAQSRLDELHSELAERKQEVSELRAQLRQTHSSYGAQHEQRWREEVELHGGVRAQRLVAEEELADERRRLHSRQEAERFNQQHRHDSYEHKYDEPHSRNQARNTHTANHPPHTAPIATYPQPHPHRPLTPRERQAEAEAEHRRRTAQRSPTLQRDVSHSPAVVRSANGRYDDDEEFEVHRDDGRQSPTVAHHSAHGTTAKEEEAREEAREELVEEEEQEERRRERVQKQRAEEERDRHEREERHRAEVREKLKERERERERAQHNNHAADTKITVTSHDSHTSQASHSHKHDTLAPRDTHSSQSHKSETHESHKHEKSDEVDGKRVDNPHAHRTISAHGHVSDNHSTHHAQTDKPHEHHHAAKQETHHSHTTKEAEAKHDGHHHTSHSLKVDDKEHHHHHHSHKKDEEVDKDKHQPHTSHSHKTDDKHHKDEERRDQPSHSHKEEEKEQTEHHHTSHSHKTNDRDDSHEHNSHSHKEHEKEKEREKEREREKDKEREREKERERDREKEREKEREREKEKLKEKEKEKEAHHTHHSNKSDDDTSKEHHHHHHHTHHGHTHKHDSDKDKELEKDADKTREKDDSHHHSHSHKHKEEEKTNDTSHSHSHSSNAIQPPSRHASSRKLAPIASSSDKKKSRDVDRAADDDNDNESNRDKHHTHHSHKHNSSDMEVEMEI